jgi:hypothetical protein
MTPTRRVSGKTTRRARPGAREHTEEILTRLLRIPKAKVEKLHAAGVV